MKVPDKALLSSSAFEINDYMGNITNQEGTPRHTGT